MFKTLVLNKLFVSEMESIHCIRNGERLIDGH